MDDTAYVVGVILAMGAVTFALSTALVEWLEGREG